MSHPKIRWGCINPYTEPENAQVRMWIKGEDDRWYALAIDRTVGSVTDLANGWSTAVWLLPQLGQEAETGQAETGQAETGQAETGQAETGQAETGPESAQEPSEPTGQDFLDDMGELLASGAAGVLRGVTSWVGYLAETLDPKRAPNGQ